MSGVPFRVLIVDDEPAARRGIVQLLAGESEFEIVGECANGEQMVAAVERESPDLVFLDVQMPDLDGFGALAHLRPEHTPLVVFVTGYDRYAVRAFEAHAIDYLLKPYSPERFRRSCRHAKRQIRQRRDSEVKTYQGRLLGLLQELTEHRSDPTPNPAPDPVLFPERKSSGRVVLISGEHVLWVEARKDYVRLHTQDGSHLVRETMANVERHLSPTEFVRVHRSAIVRISGISEIHNEGTGRIDVVLKDGTRHAVSARGRRQLQERLGFKI